MKAFLQTALEYNNIIKLSRQLGYKFNASPTANGILSFYILVPQASIGGGPDLNYMPILKRGSTFGSTNGASYILVEDVNFADSSNEIVVGSVNDAGQAPSTYAIKSTGAVISGKFAVLEFEVGSFQKFRKLEIPGGPIVSEVISVTDENGNEYYEVDYLSQDVIYSQIVNPSATERVLAPTILKPVAVPREDLLWNEKDSVLFLFSDMVQNLI